MPRKTSQAVKKDTAGADKGGAPARRSGRAVTKQEVPPPSSGKDASRSRRSSTAAQTAASVADSRTPRARGSSQRESTPPSEGKGRREGGESPVTRVKVVRSTGRINYKESDGEEDASRAAKFDEAFVSEEEFEESDSESEKSKAKGKGKPARAAAKRSPKKKSPKSKGRKGRGRPSKKKDQESEEETFDVTDDSAEPEDVTPKETPTKSPRGRKPKPDVSEEKSKPATTPKGSRRSARAASKEEPTPKKRPSRGQAKKYNEDDDEIEEIVDTKQEDEVDAEAEEDGTRKRKREASPEDTNKRLKEGEEEETKEEIESKEEKDIEGDVKEDTPAEEKKEEVEEEEPMEVEEKEPTVTAEVKDSEKSVEPEAPEEKPLDTEEKEDVASPAPEEKEPDIDEQKSVEGSESSDEPMVISEPEPVIELSPEPEIIEEAEDVPAAEKPTPQEPATDVSESSNVVNEPPVSVQPLITESEQAPEVIDITDSKPEPIQNDISAASEEVKPAEPIETPPPPHETTLSPSNDSSVNGEEPVSDIPIVIPTPPEEISVPRANGEHNDSSDRYFSLPGRKYVVNSKLSESTRQSVLDQTFGFVSLNLGTDLCLPKEKLLNELNSLEAHIICLQQVPKLFFTSVLEPSLDALGFKCVFSQPEDSLKGIATFYKSSLFRLCGHTEVSLKKLIDKELESSSLDISYRSAVRTHVKKCGNVLITHLSSVIGTNAVTVTNVQIPPTDLSIHALQVSCLAQEVVRINSGSNRPLLLGGEFNIEENDASYQLLRDGYLSNDMIEELQRRKDVLVPEKENASLLNLLWKSFQHPSSNLRSCYTSVLDHEFSIPEQKSTSPDLLWYSWDSLRTVGVLDIASDKPAGRHLSLKADIAFSV